jgi:hypothetical protein
MRGGREAGWGAKDAGEGRSQVGDRHGVPESIALAHYKLERFMVHLCN